MSGSCEKCDNSLFHDGTCNCRPFGVYDEEDHLDEYDEYDKTKEFGTKEKPKKIYARSAYFAAARYAKLYDRKVCGSNLCSSQDGVKIKVVVIEDGKERRYKVVCCLIPAYYPEPENMQTTWLDDL